MKLCKISAIVAGIAVATTMLSGTAKLAFADTNDTTTYQKAVITKELETVPGQTLQEDFAFTFAPYGDTTAGYPELSPVKVNINTSDANAVYAFNTSTARITYFANTADLVTALTTAFQNSKPGIYEYKVTETQGQTAQMTYDNGAYFLRVIKTADGLSVQVIKPDNTGNKPGTAKVDPTPDKDRSVTSTSEGSTAYKGSDFAFKNSYKLGKNAVVGKELTLTKKVAGLEPAGTAYTFTVKFVTPDAEKAAAIQVAGVNGAKGPFTNNQDGTFAVTLKQDESVTFSNIQEGSLYTVVETSKGQFTPSVAIVTAAQTANLPKESKPQGTEGNANGYTVDYASTNRTIVGDGTNSVEVTNTYTSVNPTGIIINNLPFILMVGIPVVAAAGYVVSRRRA